MSFIPQKEFQLQKIKLLSHVCKYTIVSLIINVTLSSNVIGLKEHDCIFYSLASYLEIR